MNTQSDFIVIKEGIADTSEAPRGKGILYRCMQCGGVVPSDPRDNVGCSCGNIFIDIEYFRLAVRDYSKFQVVRKIR